MSAFSQGRTFLDTATDGTSSVILLPLEAMDWPGIVTHDDMTRHRRDI